MSDEGLRAAERAFAQDPSVETESALLRERLRLGTITPEALGLATYLGYGPAGALAPPWESAPQQDSAPPTWLLRAAEIDPRLLVRLGVDLAQRTEPLWRKHAAELAPILGSCLKRLRTRDEWTPANEETSIQLALLTPWAVVLPWVEEPTPEREAAAEQLWGVYMALEPAGDDLYTLWSIGRRLGALPRRCAELMEGRAEDPEEALIKSIFGGVGSEEPSTPEAIAADRRRVLARDLDDIARDLGMALGGSEEEGLRLAQAALTWILCGHSTPSPTSEPLFTPEQLGVEPFAIREGPHALTVTVPASAFGPGDRIADARALEGLPVTPVEGHGDLSDYVEGFDTVLFGGTFEFVWDDGLKARLRFLLNRTLWQKEEEALERSLYGQITDGAGENPLDVTWQGVPYALQASPSPMEFHYRSAPEADVPVHSPLFALIAAGDLDGLRAALEAGEPLAVRDRKDRTPLFFAVAEKQAEIAEHLLTFEPTPLEQQDAFALAVRFLPDVSRSFLRHGADIHRRTKWGRTILGEAVNAGQLEVVRALLDAGADPNYPAVDSGSGYRPLHHLETVLRTAGPEAAVEIARLLIDRGADPALTNDAGQSAPLPLHVGFLHWGEDLEPSAGASAATLKAALERGALGQANVDLAALLGHAPALEVSSQPEATDLDETLAALCERWAPGPPPQHPAELLAPPYGDFICHPLIYRAAAAIARALLPTWVEDPTLRATLVGRFEQLGLSGPEGIYPDKDAYYDLHFRLEPEELGTLHNLLDPEPSRFFVLKAEFLGEHGARALGAIRAELIPWALGAADPARARVG